MISIGAKQSLQFEAPTCPPHIGQAGTTAPRELVGEYGMVDHLGASRGTGGGSQPIDREGTAEPDVVAAVELLLAGDEVAGGLAG